MKRFLIANVFTVDQVNGLKCYSSSIESSFFASFFSHLSENITYLSEEKLQWVKFFARIQPKQHPGCFLSSPHI